MSNVISVVGNLTKDSIVAQAGNSKVIKLSVADNYGYGNNKSVNYYNVSYFRNQDPEKIAGMFTKGKSVHIIGEFQNRAYKDKNGVDKTSLDIKAHAVEFAGAASDGKGGSAPAAPAAQQSAPAAPAADDDGF
jgi:single-strand DNA-binding protein